MKSLLRLLLKTQYQENRYDPPETEKGMTLIELLIGMVIAFLIITPMLAFVVDMLNTDRREQVKSNTEQDIQAAVDFIAQDLSQAIYIYDNNPTLVSTPTTTATGIAALTNFIPPQTPNETPILVFWKRQQLKNSLPVNTALTAQPKNCNPEAKPNQAGECNDIYVLALVAYYEIRETNPNSIWCQPSGSPCPTRIVRYQIQDGVRDNNSINPNPLQRYFTDLNPGQDRSPAFNPGFDLTKPTQNVTLNQAWGSPEVLVNYVHHSIANLPVPDPAECQTALGNPSITTGITPTPILETTLRIPAPGNVNSFYACVDTARNLARVTIRGNSLRRIQTDADYAQSKSAFFPTASVQVQGLGGVGK
ncbi:MULTISPECIES: hormogonium polysaccharide secretion pseudopilin HpsC [unclassified Microcoleus]|uniref:hormogonium polysaccharide secretion pseudopilin HpsC n=1 Tax=unclassified Microcoleus TaxID=2642155 RepID=UPI001D352788|nr:MULTISPECIES: hormogonium polysaccharide secretion pseudopilin HpsC [unclassified Microcoleus]MCC3453464.1 prepilin-type N-terminal cleavage/methylation domain-containing protein [Microcoleus sp. PH2017_08_TRC_O_A]MCC3566461.1 prepilin-type N-terminal cleavage/methylation domain-containing protein [Microcoleus sp. PH2017_31_RDM_U_A]MCC3578864.1 prepilin-type N-terminal cleavage/methylation domain-containing protein [Microcoleus sp. PH2017_32_RDM_D_A]MCC3616907.1 prepilin-type N-terminal clea